MFVSSFLNYDSDVNLWFLCLYYLHFYYVRRVHFQSIQGVRYIPMCKMGNRPNVSHTCIFSIITSLFQFWKFLMMRGSPQLVCLSPDTTQSNTSLSIWSEGFLIIQNAESCFCQGDESAWWGDSADGYLRAGWTT